MASAAASLARRQAGDAGEVGDVLDLEVDLEAEERLLALERAQVGDVGVVGAAKMPVISASVPGRS